MIRRRSTGQKKTGKPKTFGFSAGQKIKVTNGKHNGKQGTIVNCGKKVALIETKGRKRTMVKNGMEQRTAPIERVRIEVGHLKEHKRKQPEIARRKKRTDLASRKMAKIGQLEKELKLLETKRIYRGRKLRNYGRTYFKAMRELKGKISKLRKELTGVGKLN